MNKLTFTLLGAAVALSITVTAFGANLTNAEYKAGKIDASAKYKIEKEGCSALAGNAKDICIEEAKGHEKITKAELTQNYAPSDKHRYNVRLAKADAVYAVAKEKCDDLGGEAKDVFRKDVKSVFVSAKADATVAEKTSEAATTAMEKATDARKDAATDKSDAAYDVAKEKCDALANDFKTNCIKSAKVMYGKM